MKARVKWVEGRTFIGEAGTGHSILFGGLHGDDGYRPRPTPMACSSWPKAIAACPIWNC